MYHTGIYVYCFVLVKQSMHFNENFSFPQEYATTVKSADVGLAWEVHFRAKRQFELTDLKVIFQFCLQVQSTSVIVIDLLQAMSL